MTFSQRRRLLNLLWALVSNGSLPFILGFVFSLISVTHVVTESFYELDKAGFGTCIKPAIKQGGNQ